MSLRQVLRDEVLHGIQCPLAEIVARQKLKFPEQFDEEVRSILVLRDQCRNFRVDRFSERLEQRELTRGRIRFPGEETFKSSNDYLANCGSCEYK